MLVWFDNWYWERYSSDPGTPVRSLNISAVAVLHIPDLRPFPGHRSYQDMHRGVADMVRFLRSELGTIVSKCEGIIAEPIDETWIRVPLDFNRENMRSLQWRPISRHSDDTMSTSLDFPVGVYHFGTARSTFPGERSHGSTTTYAKNQ